MVKYGTNSHKILLISKFYGSKISFKELNYINPVQFKTKSSVSRELLRLSTLNLIIPNEDRSEWKISSKGISTLYEMSQKYVKDNGRAQ